MTVISDLTSGQLYSYATRMAAKSVVTEINGSLMEGGGQILRNSVSLACICGIALRVVNIRGGRTPPGLQRQHLTGVELAKRISSGRLEGAELKSQEIVLRPGPIVGGEYSADVKSAGSVMLLLQVALPCLLFGDTIARLSLRGGTNAKSAPQVDHTILVLCPLIRLFGVRCDLQVVRRGYFPKGGGEVRVEVEPVKALNSVSLLDMGKVVEVKGIAYVAGRCPKKVLHEMADSAEALISRSLPGVKMSIERSQNPHAPDTASGMVLCAITDMGCHLGGSSLGSQSELGELTGERAAEELLEAVALAVCVDKWAQDQVLIFMALAGGKSVVRCGPLTLHSETAMYIADRLLGVKFQVTPVNPDKKDCKKYPCFIQCEGIGKKNPHFS